MLTIERFYGRDDDITAHMILTADTRKDEWAVEWVATDEDGDNVTISIRMCGRKNFRALCELFRDAGLDMLETHQPDPLPPPPESK